MMFRVGAVFISTVPCRVTSRHRCSSQGSVVEARGDPYQTSCAAARETTRKQSRSFAGNDSKEVRYYVEMSHNLPVVPFQERRISLEFCRGSQR